MTVYKYFLKIALKNKMIIIAYTMIFFVIALMNGSSNTQKELDFQEYRLDIGIINHSQDNLSDSLVDFLSEKHNIVEIEDSETDIKEKIFLNIADAVIIIKEDMEIKVANKEEAVEIYKDDREMSSYQIENQVNKFITFANASYNNGVYDLENIHRALGETSQVEILKTEANNINKNANAWFKFYFNFTGYIIIAIYIAVIGYVMTDFTEENINSRMNVSSIKFLKINKEIYLGQLTLATLITIFLLVGAILIKSKYIFEVDFLKYTVNLFVFSFAILCLVYLINNLTRNRFVITALSTVLSLGTAFISGVMVPQYILGEKVLAIAKFFPTYYYVKINDMNITSLSDVAYELFMQVLFAMAFLAIGLYFSKVKKKA